MKQTNKRSAVRSLVSSKEAEVALMLAEAAQAQTHTHKKRSLGAILVFLFNDDALFSSSQPHKSNAIRLGALEMASE